MKHFSDQYCNIISDILQNGVEETNNRTGVKTKALPGVQFQVDLAREFPLLTARQIRVENFVAEMMWFISGQKDTNVFLNRHTKIWDAFTTEDGEVETAYGHRWRHHFGRDQLVDMILLLTKDPSSRHGVVVTWDPADDGLLHGTPKKNVPCPYTFTVNIIGGRLHLHNIIRSNDMVLGCPTDAAGFAYLACLLARLMNVKPGIYTHSISNAHIYENHYAAAEEMVERANSGLPYASPIVMEENGFAKAESLDESYFDRTVKQFKENYNPLPAIKGLIIAL